MGQHTEDAAMDKANKSKVSPAYILAAAAIWALILYSVSSLYRPEPSRPESSRIALGALQVCQQTP